MSRTPSKPTKPKYYETEAFKELDAKWKSKLAKAGFNDIEYEDGTVRGHTGHMMERAPTQPGAIDHETGSPQFNVVVKKVYYESVEEYYRLAGHFLHDFKFASDRDRLIWQLHAEGISERNIVLALKKKRIKSYKLQVHNVITKLEAEMLKQCLPNQT